MADNYYFRLTVVHPNSVSKLDPRVGMVLAETATTGRYIIADVSWDSIVSANNITTVAFNFNGEIKIYEPLGMSMFDWIRAAAYQLGISNHLDAKFLLEMELLAENLPRDASPFKYIWPIMIVTTDIKGAYTEKGTEYNLKFVPTSHHTQTDMVQPTKETIKIEAGTVGEYFTKLQRELEVREFRLAEARQKAGSPTPPGGNNPAASDIYHDEFHFIVEPQLQKFTFTTKGKADSGIQTAWDIRNLFPRHKANKIMNISMRPGTTLIQQINRILTSTNEVSNLLPGKGRPQTPGAQGTSKENTGNLQGMLQEVYQFFRIETHTVYKAFDYIRGRYAVKHIFLVYLADQPNMYHYPDEIDLLNLLANKDKAIARLKYYIQQGLLQKVYYHLYTGLNTDILKIDLTFNQLNYLPSFPVLWTDRHETGEGQMNKQNYSRRNTPYVDENQRDALWEIKRNQEYAKSYNNLLRGIIDETPGYKGKSVIEYEKAIADGKLDSKYSDLKNRYITVKRTSDNYAEIARQRQQELDTQTRSQPLNQINTRQELLESLKGKYIEDIDADTFQSILDNYIQGEYPSLRPRMESTQIGEYVDLARSENELLMEKLFEVLCGPRDLMELELEIFADPFWLGVPNALAAGAEIFNSSIELPAKNGAAVKSEVNSKMPGIDPDWNSRVATWGTYGTAQVYKGSPLFYFLSRVPDSSIIKENDMLSFTTTDQIVGIYLVKTVRNEFKDGRWTQKLTAVKDLTVPTHLIPKDLVGEGSFENYVDRTLGEEPVRNVLEQQAQAQQQAQNKEDQARQQAKDNQLADRQRKKRLLGRSSGL